MMLSHKLSQHIQYHYHCNHSICHINFTFECHRPYVEAMFVSTREHDIQVLTCVSPPALSLSHT